MLTFSFLKCLAGWSPGRPKDVWENGMDVRASKQVKPSLSVLVVDDNEVNQLYMQHLLRKMGHAPVAAIDGRQALAAMDSQTFDLILMDVQLPDMDGLTLARTIRDGQTAAVNPVDIPILAITAHATDEDRLRCLEAGMNEHLAKPLRPEDLRTAMAHWVPLKTDAPTGGMPAGSKGFDLTAFTRENRPEFARRMLALFLEMAEPRGEMLRRALENGDLGAAMTAAHDLAGMAGPLRADRLHEAMKAVQEACQAGDLEAGRARSVQADSELAAVLDRVRLHPYVAPQGT